MSSQPTGGGEAAGVQNLDHFNTMLEESRKALETARADIDEQVSGMKEFAGDVRGRLDEMNQNFDAFLGKLESARTELAQAMEGLEDAAATATEDRLPQLQQTLEQSVEALTSEAEQTKTELEQGFSDLAEGFQAMTQAVDELDQGLEQAQSEVEQAFDDLDGALSEMAQKAEQAQAETAAQFDEVGQVVGGELTETLGQAFEETATHLGEEAMAEVKDTLSKGEETFKRVFDELQGQGQKLAEELYEHVGGKLGESVQQVGENAKGAVEDAVKGALDDIVQQVVDELVDMGTRLAVGQAVTAGIAPIFPELAAVKVIVGRINDLLEALDPF